MKELKFNEETQRAIDDLLKTMTRRPFEVVIDEDSGYVFYEDQMIDIYNWKELIVKYCPYGKVGDINNGVKITDIRVERLQEISEEDAINEGIESDPIGDGLWENYLYPLRRSFKYVKSPIDSFESLWQSIYKNHPTKAWEFNRWVWVITFEKVKATRIDNDFKQLVNDFCERNPKLFCENHPKMKLNPKMIALRSGYSNGAQIDKYWSDTDSTSIPNAKLMNQMLDVMRQHEPEFDFKLDRYKIVKE